MAGYSYCSDWAVATIVHFVLLWKNSALTWSVALIDLIPAQPSSTIATAHTHKTKRTKQTNKCCSHRPNKQSAAMATDKVTAQYTCSP